MPGWRGGNGGGSLATECPVAAIKSCLSHSRSIWRNSCALIFGSELALILALLRFFTLLADVEPAALADEFLLLLLLLLALLLFSLLLLLLSLSSAADEDFPFFLTLAAAAAESPISPSTPSGCPAAVVAGCDRRVKFLTGNGGGWGCGCDCTCFDRFLSTKPGRNSTVVVSGQNLFFTDDKRALCDE